MMDAHVKNLWLEELRSGKHAQATGVLTNIDKNTGKKSHCCLGVLCEVAVNAGLDLNVTEYSRNEAAKALCYGDNSATLPEAVQEWAGMKDDLGALSERIDFNGKSHGALTELNDAGMTFAEIADIIESEF